MATCEPALNKFVTMPFPSSTSPNLNPSFYLIGDEISTAQSVILDAKWKLEDVKRAVGGFFHVAHPLGRNLSNNHKAFLANINRSELPHR